ncbi:MAG: hypothetical protein ABII01_05060, partial [Candidatus Woesearchaeota archaeon]
SGYDFAMYANGVEKARLTTAGKLGIGATTPNQTLHISGTINASGNVSFAQNLTLYSLRNCNLETNAQGETICGVDDTGAGGSSPGWTTTSNYLYNDTPAVNIGLNTSTPAYKLQIDASDKALNVSNTLFVNSTNVGIGTDLPEAKLHLKVADAGTIDWEEDRDHFILESDSNATMQLATVDGGYSVIGFSSTNNRNRGGIWYDHGLDRLLIRAAATNVIIINNNSYVGIGTTIPNSTLHIVPPSDTSMGVHIGMPLAWTYSPNFHHFNDTNTSLTVVNRARSGTGDSAAPYFRAADFTNNDTAYTVAIYNLWGNKALYASGAITTTNATIHTGSVGGTTDFNSFGDYTLSDDGLNGTNDVYIGDDLEVDGNASFEGNVGIGRINATSKFHINGSFNFTDETNSVGIESNASSVIITGSTGARLVIT